ncbi:hypothetical protein Q31b_19120 [Novipirellula aureliae]|uniref:Right handed beta helix domain-containing protein n=1 Tax=Novipirellula aureliae TaxID=2527966 RepID=A0A5C6EA59_9BACT|nr:right-handed parallel beta-helix repeat-containing protein [Novipirellula aureliae]TWU44376.1 hypothetical protein Q31b_19120 [Novipirellula aureliae]
MRKKNWIATLALMAGSVFGAVAADSAVPADFYVSTEGSDQWSGTLSAPDAQGKDGPFATLERARNAVRELKKTRSGDHDRVVLIRGGTYPLEKTVVFGLEDSGVGDSTITYAAYPDETPVFSSGREIEGWKKLETAPSSLPAAAAGKVWVADVPNLKDARWRFYTLYDADGRLPRARSEGFIPTVKPGTLSAVYDRDLLHFPAGALKNWANLEDVEVIVRPRQGWVMNILPLESVDEKAKIATTVFTATYLMEELHLIPGVDCAWVENVLEALDAPGEWVLNTREGKLYLWARNGEKPKGVVAPLLKESILVQGQEGQAGAADIPVRNLCFKGLTFMHGERYSWAPDDKGIQHDWEMFDKANALMRFRFAAACTVDGCHFVHSGGTAIRSDLYGQNLTIQNNHIEYMGGTGILFCGYSPGAKDVNKHNLVYNNHIQNVGEIYWHSPAVFIWQSGQNRIANNLIHNTPYAGVIISGLLDRFERRSVYKEKDLSDPYENRVEADESNHFSCNNLVEYNEIHHGMEVMGDGNGIYLRGAGIGNVIRQNYIHHFIAQEIVMQSAIRTDGLQKGTLITGNLLYQCVSHGIHLKNNNRVENNLIVDIIESVHKGKIFLPAYLKLKSGPLTGGSIQRNVLYHTRGPVEFYDQGAGRDPLALAWAKEADTDYNIYFCAENPEAGRMVLVGNQEDGVDQHSLAVDPLFVDPENGDFRFRPNSPALNIGIVPFDMSEVGLRNKKK